jgi:hypothetical protein
VATLVIASDSGSVTFAAMIAGAQGTAGRYWLECSIDGKEYRTERIKAPGETGSKLKRHGFDRRAGFAVVLYVATSASNCGSARITDENLWANQKISVSDPAGGTLAYCEITRIQKIDGPVVCESGKYLMQVRIEFEEVRL